MTIHQTMANALRPLLALADCPNCNARQSIDQARAVVGQAQQVLRDFHKFVRALEEQGLLDGLETKWQTLPNAAEVVTGVAEATA